MSVTHFILWLEYELTKLVKPVLGSGKVTDYFVGFITSGSIEWEFIGCTIILVKKQLLHCEVKCKFDEWFKFCTEWQWMLINLYVFESLQIVIYSFKLVVPPKMSSLPTNIGWFDRNTTTKEWVKRKETRPYLPMLKHPGATRCI